MLKCGLAKSYTSDYCDNNFDFFLLVGSMNIGFKLVLKLNWKETLMLRCIIRV